VRTEKPKITIPAIDAYGPDGFRIGGEWRDGGVMLRGGQVAAWPAADLDALTLETLLETLGPGEPELVVLGAGATMRFAPEALRRRIEGRRIGLEIAATPAACRTYNVLIEQGRDVAAALIPAG